MARLTPDMKKQIIELASSLGVFAIASEVGCSSTSVYKICKRNSVRPQTRINSSFGDRFGQQQGILLDPCSEYFDSNINAYIKVYPTRFAIGYRGRGL